MEEDVLTRLENFRPGRCYNCVEYGCEEECSCPCESSRQLALDAAAEIRHLREENVRFHAEWLVAKLGGTLGTKKA